MVASRKRRTEEHKLLIASFRIRKDLDKACSKASPSASNVFWAGAGMEMFPASERIERSLCKTFQARNRLCFEDSNSSRRSWIAFGVIDMANSVHKNTFSVKTRLVGFGESYDRRPIVNTCCRTQIVRSPLLLLRRNFLHQKSYSQASTRCSSTCSATRMFRVFWLYERF
jgi:hypothetical protein